MLVAAVVPVPFSLVRSGSENSQCTRDRTFPRWRAKRKRTTERPMALFPCQLAAGSARSRRDYPKRNALLRRGGYHKDWPIVLSLF